MDSNARPHRSTEMFLTLGMDDIEHMIWSVYSPDLNAISISSMYSVDILLKETTLLEPYRNSKSFCEMNRTEHSAFLDDAKCASLFGTVQLWKNKSVLILSKTCIGERNSLKLHILRQTEISLALCDFILAVLLILYP